MTGRRPVLAWVAYYDDWSGFRIFRSEVAALRHAVGRSMEVVSVASGEDPREVARAAAVARRSDPLPEDGGAE
jgi:hypothetical protein